MNLGDIMLDEISQSQKDKHCNSTYMRYLVQAKYMKKEEYTVVSKRHGSREWVVIKGYRVFFSR